MADQQNTTALARLSGVAQVITNPKDLADRISEWKPVAHILAPVVQLSALAEQYVVAPAVLKFDARMSNEGQGIDVYRSGLFHKNGECSLTRVALDKLCASAGASISTTRVDPRTILHYWEMQATIKYRDFDGTFREVTRSADFDLRDGSELAKTMSAKQLAQARRFGLRHCEARACNAAARAAWGLPGKYTQEEAGIPFITLRVMFKPDMKDPEQRRLVTANGLGATAALYPGQAAKPDPDVIDVEPEPERPADTQAPTNGNGSRPSETARPEPQQPTGPTIATVETKSGETVEQRDARGTITTRAGIPYTKYTVTLDDGRVFYTYNEEIGKLAQKLAADKRPVEIEHQARDNGNRILELQPAVAGRPDPDAPTADDLGAGLKL